MKYYLPFLILLMILMTFCSNLKKIESVAINFTSLQTNSDASLRGLFVVNENIVWASGSGGTVLLTANGGESWKNIQVRGAEENDFRSIHAWDEKKAIVFGVAGPAFGYLTDDAGETWQVVFQDSTEGLFFNSLKFTDSKNGLAVSDPIEGKLFVIKTSDGGISWRRIKDIPDVMEGEANFAASNTCIEFLPSGKAWIATGGSVARVFYSDDFGENWEAIETPIISGKPASGIFSVCFKNDLEGVIVGGTYGQPELNDNIAAFTNDGGKTWSLSDKMPKEYRSCVQYISNGKDDFFFAIGKTGCDISTDNGITWNFLSKNGYYTFRVIPGKYEGFATSSDGRIANVEIKY